MIVSLVFISLAALSLAIVVWQWAVAIGFPLHQRKKKSSFAPAITLLKPLKGADLETKGCLESWLQQDYAGEVQVLFGVADANDPVCAVVRDLISQNVKRDLQLVVCPEQLGPNAKVSTLIHLEKIAQHEFIVISDADVQVPPDFLSQTIPLLEKPEIGLVNCFYQFANPSNAAMRWEAIAVNADFWSQVLQSQSLKPIDFALGAAMATRREQLRAMGGFASLVSHLADDYQLGHRIAKSGKSIALSSVVVECRESSKTWKQIWAHQLRWARTLRVCQPSGFFFSILNNAILWSLLATIALLFLAKRDWKIAIVPMLLVWPLRIAIALNLEERLTKNFSHYAYAWLIPIKDLLGTAIWALAFFGNEVEWRGEKFRVKRGGELEKISP